MSDRAISASGGVIAKRLVLLVGAAYLVAQLVLFSPGRAPSWDEAVYLSQVTPGVRPLFFAPSRARGITVLVAPVTELGGSVTAVRLFLVVVSAIALTAASLGWVATIGSAAFPAAFFLGFSWLGLFYGSEVMPNLWAAVLGLAATGVLVRRFGGDLRRRDTALAATLVGLAAIVRPLDAFVLAALLTLAVVLFGPSPRRPPIWLAAAIVLGWVPWLVEMSMRYGDPVAALRAAGSVGHLSIGGVRERLLQNLSLTNGPAIGPELPPHVPLGGVLWWGGVVVLAALGLLRVRNTPAFRPVLTAALTGLALAAEYLVFVAGVAPRFLLPAYALLAVPAAMGLTSLWERRASSRTAGIAAVVALGLIVAWAGWQVGTARRIEATAVASRASARDVGLVLRARAGGDACAFASTGSWPQIAFASGCAGIRLRPGDDGSLGILEELTARGERAFVVLRDAASPGSLAGAVTPVAGPAGWFVYELAPMGASQTGWSSRWFLRMYSRQYSWPSSDREYTGS